MVAEGTIRRACSAVGAEALYLKAETDHCRGGFFRGSILRPLNAVARDCVLPPATDLLLRIE
jgi:hypothetical protein